MLYSELVNEIKTEARIAGDSSFDALVVGLINEVSIEAVQSQRPFELRSEVVLPIDTNGLVSLPADYLFHHEIIFRDSDTSKEWELKDQDSSGGPAPRGFYGHPKTYEVLADAKISVKPFSSVVPGDTIFLIYYRQAPVLLLNGLDSVITFGRLNPFIIRSVVRRLRLFHSDDVQVAQLLQGDIASAANGYMKDVPVPDKELPK